MEAAKVAALRQEHYNATVIGRRRVHAELFVLRLRPDAPLPAYEAGQWLQAGLGLWEPRLPDCPAESLANPESMLQRTYSLSCAIMAEDAERLLTPEEHDWYELYIGFDRERATDESGAALAARFALLEPGMRAWVGSEPRGNYTLSTVRAEDDVLFLATGTGEAPHQRMVWELLRRGHRGRIAAVVTARRRADLGYGETHERLMRRFPPYRWLGVPTREPGVGGGRLQALLASGALEERTGIRLDPRRCHVFLCGHPGMLGRWRLVDGRKVYPEPPGMIELLERRGYRVDPPEGVHVHFER